MKQKIERLRELMEKATSLPWQSKHDYTIEGEFSIIGNVDGEIHHDGCEYTYTAIADIYQNEDVEQDRANLRLILEAINALPDLLSHIDALEARVEEAETIAGIAAIPDVAGMAERLEAAERALEEAVEVLRPFADLDHEEEAAASLLGARDGNAAVRVPRRHLRQARAFLTKRGEKSNA